MPGAIVIDPREMKAAADAVADRVELCNRAGAALAAVDLSCEMPPGIAGQVRSMVNGARADLLASTAKIGPLTADLLARVDQAERADRIGKAFGGLLNAGGLVAGKLEFAGRRVPLSEADIRAGRKPEDMPRIFGRSAPPDAVLKWAKRASKGLTWVGNGVAVVNSAKNALDNPYLTNEQRATKITAEGGSSILKTALAAGAGGAVAGSIVPGPGTAAGAAAAFTIAVGVGVISGAAMEWGDKKSGATKHIEKGLTKATSAVGDGARAVAGGATKLGDRASEAAADVRREAGQAGRSLAAGAERGARTVAAEAKEKAKDVADGAKDVAAGAKDVADAAGDAVDGALGKVGL